MRHIAIESGAFVVSVPQYIPGSAFPDDFPVPVERDRVYGRGGAVIVEPTGGEVIAGPLYDAEGILVADCDLRAGLHAKRWFDAVGHYSREDVLARGPNGAAPASTRASPRRSVSRSASKCSSSAWAYLREVPSSSRKRARLTSPSASSSGDEAVAHGRQRLRVDVHGRAEAHDAAGVAQRGELASLASRSASSGGSAPAARSSSSTASADGESGSGSGARSRRRRRGRRLGLAALQPGEAGEQVAPGRGGAAGVEHHAAAERVGRRQRADDQRGRRPPGTSGCSSRSWK